MAPPLPTLTVGAGVLFGAVAIGYAAWRGMPHWQSIPQHLGFGGGMRTPFAGFSTPARRHRPTWANCETSKPTNLYHPSVLRNAVAAVLAQLTGAAPTTAYTLMSLATAVWLLFPVSAALLTWHCPAGGGAAGGRRSAVAGALSASFTAIPYVESGCRVDAQPRRIRRRGPHLLSDRHRGSSSRSHPAGGARAHRVFSVHITGGVVVVTFVMAWWLLDALPRPVHGRARDFVTLLCIAVPSLLALLPQFLGVLQQAEIIAGHAFVTHQGRKRTLFNAVVQHTRHLNDFPIQNAMILLAAIGFVLLLTMRDLVAGGGVGADDRGHRPFRCAVRGLIGATSASTATCSTAIRDVSQPW